MVELNTDDQNFVLKRVIQILTDDKLGMSMKELYDKYNLGPEDETFLNKSVGIPLPLVIEDTL